MNGKSKRLTRILGRDGRTVIVPIDQSITSGPIDGLRDMKRTIDSLLSGGPNAVLMHRGPVMAGLFPGSAATGLIVHLSGGTQLSDDPMVKTPVCTVEDALRLGADAVSVHISLGLGNERDGRALAELGKASGECHQWGVPILAMMYVYGEHKNKPEGIIHAARVGAELGADLIKVNYTGDEGSFAKLIDTCYVPVVVAGGEVGGDGLETLRMADTVLAMGAAGVCVGRNVYAHRSPTRMAKALSAVVHEGLKADEAYGKYLADFAPSAGGDRIESGEGHPTRFALATAPRAAVDDDDDAYEMPAGHGAPHPR